MPIRPNIVLIHCHDLGTWLSCYGMPSVPSPNLERLAAESVVFDSAFATSPLCTPARSSIFTGLRPHQNGLMGLAHDGWHYRRGVETLPEMMHAYGYHSALVGLQHEDLDARTLGYDAVHGMGFLSRALEVAKRVDRWLDGADGTEPFFLTVGMWEAHRPWPTTDYRPTDPATVDVPPYLPDNAHTRQDISEFHGAIRQMDEAVGSILRSVDSSPFADNTLVIFTTDHGAAFPRAKSTLYDSGVQVALLVRPPRTWSTRPARHTGMVSHLDLAPSLVQLAGGTSPAGLEGRSFVPLLQDSPPVPEPRELVLEKTYHDRYDPIRALRTNDVKYIRNFVPGPQLPFALDLEESATRRGMDDGDAGPKPAEELYLLRDDPWELENVAKDPQHQELRAAMSRRLEGHLRRTADPILDGAVLAPAPPGRGERRAD
ncbi:sulfatase [Georgenia halophila]|uniref:sulfatase family protein n=1 Tax=Georgenia halophila TaxID=620889 RepID=UPI0031F06875